MSTAATCPLCAGPLPDDRQPCPQCHASPGWIEQGQAVDFALRHFQDWLKKGLISERCLNDLADYYARQREVCTRLAREGRPVPENTALRPYSRCWCCAASSADPGEYCADCGAPWDTPGARSLRFLTFLHHEIKKHGDAGRLPLSQAHDGSNEVRERIAALRQKLEKQRLPAVVAAAEPRPSGSGEDRSLTVAEPRRNVMDILLAPRTIQCLLGLGGAMLVIGLVIYLAVLGIFENAVSVAVLLGIANAAVLVSGWTVILRTRYQTAGRALTLLACLVMPLNLWYYDYNGLVTFEHNLWLPALVCCVLYAASALVLRDHLFVYVLFGGIALTGLLILAERHHFHEIALPSTLLVVLGLIGLHLERAFAEGEGPFARRRFGMACFWSGQALLAGGLLLLLGGQLAGWLYGPVFQGLGLAAAPDIYTDDGLQLLAIALVLAGTYAYVYSDVVVRQVGGYMYLAVFTLLWAEGLTVRLLHLQVPMEAMIAVLALTALALNLIHQARAARTSTALGRAMPPLGVFLAALPVALGALLHFRATNADIHALWPYEIQWPYVGAMVLTAGSCRVGAYIYRHSLSWLSMVYFFGAAAATLAGAAGLLYVLDLKEWDWQAVILILVPILYLIASRIYRGHTAERPLIWVAHAATAFLIVGVLTASLEITPQVAGRGVSFFEPITQSPHNLLWAAFCAEAAIFYGLATGLRKQGWTIYPATALACGAVWQLLLFSNVVAPEYYALAFALLGFALLVVYRLAVLERFEKGGLAPAAFGSANALMSLAFLAAALLALSRLAARQSSWSLSGLLLALAVLSLAASWLVRHPVWRPWYVIMSITEALLLFVAVEMAWDLTVWQKVEIFSVVVGVLLLLLGHWGWQREQVPDAARQSESVSLALFFGSLLVGLPLAVAVLIHRGRTHHFSKPDELGMLAAGVLLLASGFMLRLRSSTLVGASLLGLYLLTLPMLIKKIAELEWSAILLMIGGAVVLGLGLVLSIFHDRLRMLPEKIKRREGIFRVLSWR